MLRFSKDALTSTHASSIFKVGLNTYILLTGNLEYRPSEGSNINVLTSCDLPLPDEAVISSLNDSNDPKIYDLVGSKLII